MPPPDEALEWKRRADTAEALAGPAYVRLLELAETPNSGQIPRVARFLASTFNGDAFPFNLFHLRSLDVAIGDDVLLCMDALRWAKCDLHNLLPSGQARVLAVLELWEIEWPAST